MLTITPGQIGASIIRWNVGDRAILVGFISSANKFRTAHPSLDAIDGARWGDNIKGQIVETMKGESK